MDTSSDSFSFSLSLLDTSNILQIPDGLEHGDAVWAIESIHQGEKNMNLKFFQELEFRVILS